MGAERAEGLRWHDFDATRGRLSAGSLADVLPVHHGVSTLSWDRSRHGAAATAVPSVLTAAVRGFDLVVADVPRHLDGFGVDIVGRSVLSVLVVAEDICGVGAARHVLDGLQQAASSIVVVSVGRPGGIGPAAVSDALGLPVLARHRVDRRIRAAVDRGLGPGRSRAARRTASAMLDTLGLETVVTRAADPRARTTAAGCRHLRADAAHRGGALRAEHHVAGSGTVLALVDQLRSETRGAGLLDPLLATPGVTDVLVNGPDEVYLDRGRGWRSRRAVRRRGVRTPTGPATRRPGRAPA